MYLMSTGPAFIALVIAMIAGASLLTALIIAAVVSGVAGLLVGVIEELKARGVLKGRVDVQSLFFAA